MQSRRTHKDIFQALALQSEKRIVLAALYLGTGTLEQNLVQNIREAILNKPQSLQLTGRQEFEVEGAQCSTNQSEQDDKLRISLRHLAQ